MKEPLIVFLVFIISIGVARLLLFLYAVIKLLVYASKYGYGPG